MHSMKDFFGFGFFGVVFVCVYVWFWFFKVVLNTKCENDRMQEMLVTATSVELWNEHCTCSWKELGDKISMAFKFHRTRYLIAILLTKVGSIGKELKLNVWLSFTMISSHLIVICAEQLSSFWNSSFHLFCLLPATCLEYVQIMHTVFLIFASDSMSCVPEGRGVEGGCNWQCGWQMVQNYRFFIIFVFQCECLYHANLLKCQFHLVM